MRGVCGRYAGFMRSKAGGGVQSVLVPTTAYPMVPKRLAAPGLETEEAG